MSFSTKSFASRVTIGTSLFRSLPVTPVEAMTSLASKSLNGMRFEKCRRPTLSGCSSATCSMSMPPTGEKMMTGFLRGAVPDDARVELLVDVGLGVDEDAARHVAVDLEHEHVARVRLGLLGRVGELHAAGLHAAAREHLRLDHRRTARCAAAISLASCASRVKP